MIESILKIGSGVSALIAVIGLSRPQSASVAPASRI